MNVTFFWQQKKVTKENCACYDASCVMRQAIAAVIHDGLNCDVSASVRNSLMAVKFWS